MSIFTKGAYVRLRHHWDLPSDEWGNHGVILRTANKGEGRVGLAIVKWDNPNMIGSFVAMDFLEISDKHTLWLGDYGVFSKAKDNG